MQEARDEGLWQRRGDGVVASEGLGFSEAHGVVDVDETRRVLRRSPLDDIEETLDGVCVVVREDVARRLVERLEVREDLCCVPLCLRVCDEMWEVEVFDCRKDGKAVALQNRIRHGRQKRIERVEEPCLEHCFPSSVDPFEERHELRFGLCCRLVSHLPKE